jgi:hypothetical protein
MENDSSPEGISRGAESEVRTTISVAVDDVSMVEYAVQSAGGVEADGDSAPTTVLLRGSGDPSEEMWGPLWAQRDPRETNVLAIASQRNPVEWLDAWEEEVGDLPRKVGVIRVGRPLDSRVDLDRSKHEGISLPLTSVERPSDLGELYTAITLYATEWLHTDQKTVVWLESLTPLLENVGIQRTLDFVDRLGDRLETLGATAYFGLDPAVHEKYTADVFRSSFDLVVEADGSEEPLRAIPEEALAAPRRRAVLRALLSAGGSLSIEDGAARVAARENDRHPDGVEPIEARLVAIDLQHAHLPKLAEAGLIEVDTERRVASLSVPAVRVDAYLARTEADGPDGTGEDGGDET